MRFLCRRDAQTSQYDLNPGSDTVEDLMVLIAADYNIPLEEVAVRCGSKPSWTHEVDGGKQLAEMIQALAPPGPTPLTLTLSVMTREAAQQLDAAAARITGLFSSSASSSLATAPPLSGMIPQLPSLQPMARLEDEEVQRRLYEEIQQRNIQENLVSAIEYTPEAFAQVTMLYVNCVINGVKLKAFVDSGAQMSIMNVKTAERCGLLRLVDRRMKGVAVGVGKQTIIGRIHLVTVQLESLHIPFSFSVLEDQAMDIIIGLDQLKRHQFSINLKTNCLCFDDNIEIPFLPESELPDFAKLLDPDREMDRAEGGNSPNRKSPGRRRPSPSTSPSRKTPRVGSQSQSAGGGSHKAKKGSPPPTTTTTPALTATSVSLPLASVSGGRTRSPVPTASTAPSVAHNTAATTTASGLTAARRKELVRQLRDFTGMTSDSEAAVLLDLANWDVETAAGIYFAQNE